MVTKQPVIRTKCTNVCIVISKHRIHMHWKVTWAPSTREAGAHILVTNVWKYFHQSKDWITTSHKITITGNFFVVSALNLTPIAAVWHTTWRVMMEQLLPRHPLHPRVPLQAAQGHLPHPHLPLQRQLPRSHLPWYSQGQLESCSHYIKGNFIQVTIGHACMCQNFQVLLSICSLLTDCNPNDPLVGSIAQQVNASKW